MCFTVIVIGVTNLCCYGARYWSLSLCVELLLELRTSVVMVHVTGHYLYV